MSEQRDKQDEKQQAQEAVDFAERTRSAHEALVRSLRGAKVARQAA